MSLSITSGSFMSDQTDNTMSSNLEGMKKQISWKVAVLKMLSSLTKDSHQLVWGTVFLLVEFFQLLAFAFVSHNWGPIGREFGVAIRWAQIELALASFNIVPLNIALFIIAAVFLIVIYSLTAYCLVAFAKNNFFLGMWPLHVLRALVSNLCGVLFLPIFSPLVSGLYCQVATTTKNCTSSAGQGVFAASIILTIITIPYTLSMSMTYFNPNTKALTFYGRLDAKLEFLECIARYIFVFMHFFTHDTPAFPVVLSICFLGLASYIFFFLPYFNPKINMFRFCTFVALFWSSLIAIPVSFIENKDSNTLFWVWLAILPIIVAAASFGIKWRLNSLTHGLHNKVLVSLSSRGITYESTEGKKLEENLVHAIGDIVDNVKFFRPFSVEIHTRFLQKSSGNLDIAIAYSILNRGIQLFSEDTTMHTIMGIFNGVWLKDIMGWQNEIETVRSLKMNFLKEFSLYQQQGELEALKESLITGENLDIVASLELNHTLRLINRAERQCVKRIKFIWKLLSSGKARARDIMHVVQIVKATETETLKTLKIFRKKYPQDHRILMAAARFENNVCYNFKKADEYAFKSLQIQQKKNQKESKHASKINSKAGSQSHISRASSSKNSHANSLNASLSGPKSIFGRARKDTVAQNQYRSGIYNYRPSVAKRNLAILLLVLVPLAVMSLVESIWIATKITGIEVSMLNIRYSAERRNIAVDFADHFRDMQYSILGGPYGNWPKSIGPDDYKKFDELEHELIEEVELWEELKKELLTTDYPGSLTYDLWRQQKGSGFDDIYVYDESKQTWRNQPMSALEASSFMHTVMSTGVTLRPRQFYDGSVKENPAYRFIVDQMAYAGANGFNAPTVYYIKQASQEIQYILNILLITLGIVFGMLLFFGLFVFRPLLQQMVKDVLDYQKKVLEILMSIPKSDCSAIVAKLNAQDTENLLKSNEAELDDEEDSDFSGGEYAKGKGSGTGDQGYKFLFAELMLMSVVGLLSIGAFFGLHVAVNYVSANDMRKYGNLLEYTMDLEESSARIVYYTRELVKTDDHMFIDMRSVDNNALKDEEERKKLYKEFCIHAIEHDTEHYNELKNSVIFGNPEHDIPYTTGNEKLLKKDIEINLEDPQTQGVYLLQGYYSANDLMQVMMEDAGNIMGAAHNGVEEPVTEDSVMFSRLRAVKKPLMARLDEFAIEEFEAIIKARDQWMALDIIMMIFTLASIIGAYWFVFRKIMNHLQLVLDQATMLLQFVPIEYGIQHFELQVFLRGRDNAKLFFEEKGWPIPERDENGKLDTQTDPLLSAKKAIINKANAAVAKETAKESKVTGKKVSTKEEEDEVVVDIANVEEEEEERPLNKESGKVSRRGSVGFVKEDSNRKGFKKADVVKNHDMGIEESIGTSGNQTSHIDGRESKRSVSIHLNDEQEPEF